MTLSEGSMWSAEESDALREVGNVAFSHAATALSTLIGRRVDISIPNLRVIPTEDVDHHIQEPEESMCVVTLRILGDRRGLLALVFRERDALALVDLLEGDRPGTRAVFTRASEGVLAEVANIMSGSALLALYRFMKVSLIHSTPVMHLRRIRHPGEPNLVLSWDSDVAVVVDATFSVGEQEVKGEMVISLADLRFFLDALKGYGGG